MPRTQLQRINDRSSPTKDTLAVIHDSVVKRLLPKGYSISVARYGRGSVGEGSMMIRCDPPGVYRMSSIRKPIEFQQVADRDLRRVSAKIITWARRDAAITAIAEGMCRKLGLDPSNAGPCPTGPAVFGPVIVGGGWGGGSIVQGPPEIRRMVDWMWETAAVLMAFDEMKVATRVQ